MSNLIEADLDALQNFITKLKSGLSDLQAILDPLKATYSDFIATYQSTQRPWVEEEFHSFDGHTLKALQLEQSLSDSLQQVLTDLQGADNRI